MDIGKIVSGMFFLILVFLVLSRASEFNNIVSTVGGFVTTQTQALQGVTTSGATVIQPTSGGNLLSNFIPH